MKIALRIILFFAVMIAVLFGSAGRWDLPFFWAIIAIYGAFMMFAMLSIDPGLRQERLHHAGLFGRTRQILVVLLHFGAQQQARLVFLQRLVVGHFLAAGLHGKVALPQRHQRFAGIGVLNDEVAPVAGQRPILNGALRARTDSDHFGDINEMVGDRVAAVGTGFAGLGDDGDATAISSITSTTRAKLKKNEKRNLMSEPSPAPAASNTFESTKEVSDGRKPRLPVNAH